MDPFASPSIGTGVAPPSNDVVMDQVKQQLAQAHAEEFFATLRDKCFSKCITRPGSSMSNGESSCVSRCVDRYIEATSIIMRAVVEGVPR